MFPLHQSNELVFKVFSDPHHQHKISQDLIMGQASLDGSDFNTSKSMGKGLRRKLCDNLDKNFVNCNDNKKQKMMHREIERQRRQEMATLYVALRSFLPLEFIKVNWWRTCVYLFFFLYNFLLLFPRNNSLLYEIFLFLYTCL